MTQPVLTLFLQIVVVLSASRVLGSIFRWFHQPRVVGEMFAGILLGPSLLGWLAPGVYRALFPSSTLGYLNALSLLGLVFFMFQVGLGLNRSELRRRSHAAILTSHASITLPFLLALVLSLYLYPRLSDDGVTFTSFALFMGASMSVTAFPVLARILTERNLLQTGLGTMAVTCAAVDDVTGWCILAYVLALVRSRLVATSLWRTSTGVIVFALLLIFGVRRLLPRMVTKHGEQKPLAEDRLVLVLLMALGSALYTEWLGLHLLFGAFLMGAIMPKDEEFVRYFVRGVEPLTVSVLLPLFFAYTGLRTRIGLIQSQELWVFCVLIILVASIGKLGGSMLASAFLDMPLRDAVGLGALMNTRGLMELVILNIGLDIKVISPALFSMMVVMALITTLMATPLLEIVCRGSPAATAIDRATDGQPIRANGSSAAWD